jgi:hypothetical protein
MYLLNTVLAVVLLAVLIGLPEIKLKPKRLQRWGRCVGQWGAFEQAVVRLTLLPMILLPCDELRPTPGVGMATRPIL